MDLPQRLDVANQIADLAGRQLGARLPVGDELSQFEHFVDGAGLEKLDLLAFANGAVHQPDVRDRAAKFVVVRVEDHRLQRRLRIALGGRNALDDRGQQIFDSHAGLAAAGQNFVRIDPQHRLHFGFDFVRPGMLQVDLVQHRHDRQVVFHRGIGVGHGLGLDPLERIDHQQRLLRSRPGCAKLRTESRRAPACRPGSVRTVGRDTHSASPRRGL